MKKVTKKKVLKKSAPSHKHIRLSKDTHARLTRVSKSTGIPMTQLLEQVVRKNWK